VIYEKNLNGIVTAVIYEKELNGPCRQKLFMNLKKRDAEAGSLADLH